MGTPQISSGVPTALLTMEDVSSGLRTWEVSHEGRWRVLVLVLPLGPVSVVVASPVPRPVTVLVAVPPLGPATVVELSPCERIMFRVIWFPFGSVVVAVTSPPDQPIRLLVIPVCPAVKAFNLEEGPRPKPLLRRCLRCSRSKRSKERTARVAAEAQGRVQASSKK